MGLNVGLKKRFKGRLLALFLLLFAQPLLAEPPTELLDTLSDSPADLAQRTEHAKQVTAIRRFLETKYLGSIYIGPGQNGPMLEYINWLMEPLESLVYKKQLMTRLRLKQVAGPTGVAKTQVARDFMEMTKRAGLIDPGRSHYQQGDGSKSMNLGRIDDFQKLASELLRATPTDGYLDVLNRHLQTYAILFFDESSHNAPHDPWEYLWVGATKRDGSFVTHDDLILKMNRLTSPPTVTLFGLHDPRLQPAAKEPVPPEAPPADIDLTSFRKTYLAERYPNLFDTELASLNAVFELAETIELSRPEKIQFVAELKAAKSLHDVPGIRDFLLDVKDARRKALANTAPDATKAGE